MSTPTSIADFLNRLGPVAVAKLDAYPIKTNVERSVTGDMVNSALQDFANLVANLLSQKQGVLTFDNTPAAGSSNPVTSAGIAAAITNQIAAALVGYMTQPQVAAAITDALAPYSTTAQTAQQIASAIATALADYSTTAQMQTAITDALTAALAGYSTSAEVTAEIAAAIAAALTGYVTGEQMTTAIAAALTDYVTTAAMNTALSGKQDKLTAMGSATKPVYVYADGTLSPCDDYAGGTKVVLNGEDKGGKSISIYAPTGKGNAEQYYGSKAPDAPGWLTPDNAPTEGSGKLVKSGGIFTAIANAVTGAINTVKTWAEGIFAKIDGYYQTLTAGAAENLVGHGTTPAVISFRPAGGTQDIGSGAASIAKIKGRTDAVNQLVNTGDTEVATISGHKYFTFVAGVSSIVNGGNPIALDDAANDKVIDLTLQYGAGREPATVAAFLAEYPEALTAPYNAGVLVPNKVTALVTDGFNQLVSEPRNMAAGNFPAFNKNTYTRVLGGVPYYFAHDALGVTNWRHYYKAYDLDGNEIKSNLFAGMAPNGAYYNSGGSGYWVESANSTRRAYIATFARDCYIYWGYGAGAVTASTPINNAIINLSHSGIRNGEYEPYWKSTLNIVHSKIYGKLEGAGERVQIAPDGFRGVGSNYDEVDIVRKEAYIRMARVDLGTLTWSLTSAGFFKSNAISGFASGSDDYLSARYATGGYASDAEMATKSAKTLYRESGVLKVIDSAYATAAAFKTAMDGVMLDFQLATPLHYTDLMYSEDGGQTFTEIPSNYRVDDFGTECRLPEGIVDGAPASTPLVAEIAYAMNAVDTLRRLPTNYLSKQSTENLLAALQTAGVIAGYTMTYDDTNEQYDFTITPNA